MPVDLALLTMIGTTNEHNYVSEICVGFETWRQSSYVMQRIFHSNSCIKRRITTLIEFIQIEKICMMR